MNTNNNVASIYGRRKTTADLSDNQYATQLNQFQNTKGDSTAVQKAQMDQQLQQQRQLRLPQERLQQTRRDREESFEKNRFSSFARTTPTAPAAAPAPQQQPRVQGVGANRFELYYSKSSRSSLQSAEIIMQGLSNYFPDSYIRQHVLAINFDDGSNLGPVHNAIVSNKRYLEIIQTDCILFDKFENYIILPEYQILKILTRHCHVNAPKQATPPSERQLQQQREQAQARYEEERAQADAQAQEQERQQGRFATGTRNTQEAMNRQRPIVDAQDAAPMPPRGMVGFSAMAKQVGADLSSPSSDVKLQHIVPRGSNSLVTAETLAEVEALPPSNMALIYGQNRGCTLGFGDNMAKIEETFVAQHNAANRTDREISSQTMSKPKKRNNEAQVLTPQRVPQRTPAPQAGPNLQHLQGLERSPLGELGSHAVSPASKAEHEQMGKPRQLKVTKPKKAPASVE